MPKQLRATFLGAKGKKLQSVAAFWGLQPNGLYFQVGKQRWSNDSMEYNVRVRPVDGSAPGGAYPAIFFDEVISG